jgi:non-heme chloroperoxidase
VIDWLGAMVLDTSRRMIIDFQREIATTDLTADATSLTIPVTIIHGDRDASAPIDLTARRYAQIIPDAEFCLYEGVAHGVMVTHADRLATDIASRVLG